MGSRCIFLNQYTIILELKNFLFTLQMVKLCRFITFLNKTLHPPDVGQFWQHANLVAETCLVISSSTCSIWFRIAVFSSSNIRGFPM